MEDSMAADLEVETMMTGLVECWMGYLPVI
jgi:hypothetical protein